MRPADKRQQCGCIIKYEGIAFLLQKHPQLLKLLPILKVLRAAWPF
jgi:hypothetical protein